MVSKWVLIKTFLYLKQMRYGCLKLCCLWEREREREREREPTNYKIGVSSL